jgi:hypothetical protein
VTQHASLFRVGRLVSLLALAVLLAGCPAKRNPVADYLDGAELQCETDAQRRSVADALNDAVSLSADELRPRRYPDYTGQAGQWDLATLFQRFIVPDQQGKRLGRDFYRDLTSPAGRHAVNRFAARAFGPPLH